MYFRNKKWKYNQGTTVLILPSWTNKKSYCRNEDNKLNKGFWKHHKQYANMLKMLMSVSWSCLLLHTNSTSTALTYICWLLLVTNYEWKVTKLKYNWKEYFITSRSIYNFFVLCYRQKVLHEYFVTILCYFHFVTEQHWHCTALYVNSISCLPIPSVNSTTHRMKQCLPLQGTETFWREQF